jgi:Mrp family chromosome partitioning ATPase/capsular polysaccharide biosynthesis protein
MTDQNGPSLLGAMSRYRVMCALIVLAIAILSVVGALATAGGAAATATIGLRTPQVDNVLVPGLQGDASLGRYTAQRARFVTSDEVMTVVADTIGASSTSSVRSRLEVQPSGTANIITVTAEGTTKRRAIDLALAVVDAYGRQTEIQVADRTAAAVDALQAQIDALVASTDETLISSAESTVSDVQLEIADLQATQAVFGNGVEFVVEPTTRSASTPALPLRELLLGIVVGLGIAATAAWARADRNRRVTDVEQAAALIERPLLGELATAPASRSGVATIDPRALPGDEYRMLWAALEQTASSGVFVLQTIGRMHSRTVTAHLAAAAARDDLAVLIVDADLGTGGLSTMFGCGASYGGLADTLRSEVDWHVNTVDVDTLEEYELALLPSGPLGPVDVSAQRIASHVQEWRAAFDYVFVDAEPIGSAHVAVKVARAADGVVLVVCDGADEREVAEVRRQAAFHGVTILGFVFASIDTSVKHDQAPAARRTGTVAGSSRGQD